MIGNIVPAFYAAISHDFGSLKFAVKKAALRGLTTQILKEPLFTAISSRGPGFRPANDGLSK
ncbi:MAG: hypothetical protein R6W69_06960 [Anaerolineales bacterium]